MSDLNPTQPPRSTPHAVGWFFDLFRYFGRAERPMDVDPDAFIDAVDLTGDRESLQEMLRLSADRQRRKRIFDEMDSFGLIESILDLYAEEVTQSDYDTQRRVWVESNAKHMVKLGHDCLERCQVEDKALAICRRTAKYGDEFRRLIYQSGKGVLGWRTTYADRVERMEDRLGRLVGFKEVAKKYRGDLKRDVSWPWDYVHFRLLGKNDNEVYGTSILEAMFRPWRQLALTEDSMLMYRLRRMPDRNAFFLQVGNMEPTESMKWVNNFRKKLRKHEFVDPASPDYQTQYNPLTPLEDVFIPVREGDEVRVDQIPGGGNIGEIYDLEYFRDALFGAARVPKAYLGFEGDINAKATLIQQDVRFARGCKRLRHAQIRGYRNLLYINAFLSNPPERPDQFNPERPENAFVLQMTPINYLEEFERLELIQLRFQIVETMSRLASDMQLDARVWATYILLNYAKLDEELVLKLIQKSPEAVTAEAFVKNLRPDQRATWNALDGDAREQILDMANEQSKGIYEPNAKERVAIARALHESPGLRAAVGRIAYYFEDESIENRAKLQADPAFKWPDLGKKTITDSFEDGAEAKQLREDLESIAKGGAKEE